MASTKRKFTVRGILRGWRCEAISPDARKIEIVFGAACNEGDGLTSEVSGFPVPKWFQPSTGARILITVEIERSRRAVTRRRP